MRMIVVRQQKLFAFAMRVKVISRKDRAIAPEIFMVRVCNAVHLLFHLMRIVFLMMHTRANMNFFWRS